MNALESSCIECGPLTYVISPFSESLTGAFIGLVVLSAFSTLFVSLSLWTILFAIIGSGTGFLVAYYGFSVKQK